MGRLICTSNIQFFSTNYFRSLRECFKKLEQITSSRSSSTVNIKSAWNSTVSNMRRSEIFPEISGIIQNKNDKIPDIVKKIENGANNPK